MRNIWYKGDITREFVQANPDYIFLFGDNTIRQGYGGQAKEMRGEPNAIGIVTKRFPSMEFGSLFTDDDFEEAKRYIDMDFARIPDSCKTIVIPYAGLGTGRALLNKYAPKIYDYILKKIEQL